MFRTTGMLLTAACLILHLGCKSKKEATTFKEVDQLQKAADQQAHQKRSGGKVARLSASTRAFLADLNKEREHMEGELSADFIHRYHVEKGADGRNYVHALLMMDDTKELRQQLDKLGVKLKGQAGPAQMARIPVNAVEKIAYLKGIKLIQIQAP